MSSRTSRVVDDMKTAVIVTPHEGAVWSSGAESEDLSKKMLFDSKLVGLLCCRWYEDAQKRIREEYGKDVDPTELKVEWVELGTHFSVKVDGSGRESIQAEENGQCFSGPVPEGLEKV